MTPSVIMSMFFFFKQKTAYEMRISDWSSDVLLFRSAVRHPVARHSARLGAWPGAHSAAHDRPSARSAFVPGGPGERTPRPGCIGPAVRRTDRRDRKSVV